MARCQNSMKRSCQSWSSVAACMSASPIYRALPRSTFTIRRATCSPSRAKKSSSLHLEVRVDRALGQPAARATSSTVADANPFFANTVPAASSSRWRTSALGRRGVGFDTIGYSIPNGIEPEEKPPCRTCRTSDRSTVSPEVAKALDGLPDLNLFRMVAHAESALVPWLRYGGTLLTGPRARPARAGAGDPAGRRLHGLGVRVERSTRRSPRPWAARARAGPRGRGRRASTRSVFTDEQKAVLRFAGDVLERRVPDFGAVRRRARRVELLMVVGHYTGIAMLIEATAIETDPPARLGR